VAYRVRRARTAVTDALADARRRVPDGAVALTFDDGPHPSSTGLILDMLADLGVPATFFCVGANARRYPDLVRRAVADGHAVGSHSMTHPHPASTSLEVLADEYDRGRQAVGAAVNQDVRLFRPPHGHLTARSAVMVRRQPLSLWLWTVDPRDWRPGAEATEIAAVTASARSGDVILLHDWVEQPLADEALDRTATVAALPRIVGGIREQGLSFTTLRP
jgi:chitooligosaccharide deacetylase